MGVPHCHSFLHRCADRAILAPPSIDTKYLCPPLTKAFLSMAVKGSRGQKKKKKKGGGGGLKLNSTKTKTFKSCMARVFFLSFFFNAFAGFHGLYLNNQEDTAVAVSVQNVTECWNSQGQTGRSGL